MKNVVIFVLILFVWFWARGFGCSAFSFTQGDQFIIGKNLDWGVGDGIVMVNPRSMKRTGIIKGESEPVCWTSRFGSVTFNQFGSGHPLGGMNEKGLVIEELSFTPSRYPVPKGVGALNEFQWIQYYLDNCKSVDEVVKNLGNVSVRKLLTGLHYFLGDCSGDCAVIEFINGKTRVYTGANLPVPVITNNRYDRMLPYLKNYSGFGGKEPIPSTVDSPSRFVRLSSVLKYRKKSPGVLPVKTAFGYLHRVKQEDTKWSIVYDLSERMIRFRTDQIPGISAVHLREFDFDERSPRFFDIRVGRNPRISPSDFTVYTKESRRRLLVKLLNTLLDSGEISPYQFQRLKSVLLSAE